MTMSHPTPAATVARQREATARFHDRMARAFASVGKTKDAGTARRAAITLRKVVLS